MDMCAGAVFYTDSKVELLSSADIRRALKEKLPHFMVPSAIIILAKLPLTPNGKVWAGCVDAELGTVIQSNFLSVEPLAHRTE